MQHCKHCRDGWFNGRFGQDVECVNGVLIDIDEFNEGWSGNTIHPVAPCHPMYSRQCKDPDGDWYNDSIERLTAASALGSEASS